MGSTKRRRTLVSAIVAASALVTLSGCTSGASPASTKAVRAPGAVPSALTPATLNVLVNLTPTLSLSFWKSQFAPFEREHPKIKINIEDQGTNSLQTYFGQLIAEGNAPDVADIAATPQLVNSGALASIPLQSWVTSEKGYQAELFHGKMYSPNAALQVQSTIFYNKSDFDKAGITSPPTTLAQLSTDVNLLKKHHIYPFQTAGQWVTGSSFQVYSTPQVFNQTSNFFSAMNAGKTSFTKSYMLKALDTWSTWIKDGDFAPGALSTTYAQSETDFLKGSAAMYMLGSFVAPTISSTPHNFKAGVFPVPTANGRSVLAVDPDLYWSITKASKHYADDLALVKYLEATPSVEAKYLKLNGTSSDRTPPVTFSEPALSNEIAGFIGKASALAQFNGAGYDAPGSSAYGTELNTEVQSLFLGTAPTVVARAMDSWWKSHP